MDYNVRSRKKIKEKAHMVKRSSVGADLHHLDEDKSITTDPGENNKRRTLKLERKENSWGFTLQTYGIKHKKTNEIEIMTYVDYVEFGGAAWVAGMRRGDVILSVNGERVGEVTHQQLVNKIRQAGAMLRLVVLFEDCCRKVELHERFLRLKTVLKSKYQELKQIEQQEIQILEKYYQSKGINRFEQIRQSIISNVSSSSDSWDAYSMVSSPNGMLSTGNYLHSQWSSATSLKSYSVGDTSSIYEEDCSYIDSDSDSEGLNMSFDHHGNQVNIHNSDSNLVRYGTADVRRVKDLGKLRMSRSSDSKLYRRSLSPIMAGQKLQKAKVASEESIVDDVFEKEVTETKKDREKTFPENKMFYAGENGSIIVPKICIEGEAVYTTFDKIDTNENVPHVDPETYHDKIVAKEIAREMAKFERETAKEKSIAGQLCEATVLYQTDTESKDFTLLNDIGTRHEQNNEIFGAENELQDVQSNGAVLKYSTSLKYGRDGSPKYSAAGSTKSVSPKSQRSKEYGIGCSLSYDELKSSVPDIRVSFHTEECEVIYINEKDETTKL